MMQGCVEPSLVYSVLYQFHDFDVIRTKIYDREMPIGHEDKPLHTMYNVYH